MQIMLAPVKLYSELIIKVSFPSCPPSLTLNTAEGGSWIPQVGQDQNKEGCRVETELERDCLEWEPYAQCWWMFLPCGEGSQSLLNWQHISPVSKTRGHRPVSWSSNIVLLWISWAGRVGGGGGANAGAESCQCAPLCATQASVE